MTTHITKQNDSLINHPDCRVCGKSIWGIAQAVLTIGTEKPAFLHEVCYERLCENAGMDKQ